MDNSANSHPLSVLISPSRKLQKKQAKKYSTVLLYNSGDALAKLNGLTIAACNPTSDQSHLKLSQEEAEKAPEGSSTEKTDSSVPIEVGTFSDKKICNTCGTEFLHRSEQKEHFKSDWHRYNLQQRIKGHNSVTMEQFEEIIGNVSSISGSESESEDDEGSENKVTPRPLLTTPVAGEGYSSESDMESARVMEEQGRKYPKIFFRNADGDLISVYRCVVQHKKNPPRTQSELISMVNHLPQKVKWAVLMASGGHFAGAILDRDKVVVQKTFHRYVVRAKRGTAQGSRDSQGNAPKSAGASLRRYNEAALKEDIQNLIASWNEHMESCDLIFLRAPSFNKKIFFSGKNPPLRKDDERIRMIPFPTRRPTHNEVRRVHQMLASIECYGEEADIQDHVPLSPPLTFNPEKGLLEVMSEEQQMSSRLRRSSAGRLRPSPLATETNEEDVKKKVVNEVAEKGNQLQLLESALSADSTPSSNVSSESEMIESIQTISTSNLKEFEFTKKPKRKKKARKRRLSKHQVDPESDVFAEEKYHLKNALYTAVKVGDLESLQSLLAIFTVNQITEATPTNENAAVYDSEAKDKPTVNITMATNISDVLETPTHTQEDLTEKISANHVAAIDLVTPTEDLSVLSLRRSQSEQNSTQNHENVNSAREHFSELESSTCNEHLVHAPTCVVTMGHSKTQQTDSLPSNSNVQCTTSITLNTDTCVPTESSSDASSSMKNPSDRTLEFESPPNDVLSPVVTADVLNEPIGDNEKTLLHVACKEGHRKIVKLLLESGADPAIKDKFGTTPYTSTNDKEVRNEFRRFMAQFPDRYDFKVAQVPSPLTAEMESERKQKEAERKRAQKKAKQERDKQKRAEEAVKEAEDREKKRFLALSDREKRALAAERRLLQQKEEKGEAVPVTVRCFQCGSDMTGKVPFEYYDYKFCTSKCLKAHRMKEKTS